MVADLQYVVDSAGEKTSVILPIKAFEEIEELLEDTYLGEIARESRDEPARPLEEFLAELRAAGEIDV